MSVVGTMTFPDFLSFINDKKYFKTGTLYTGEDLHVIRGGTALDLSYFFNTSGSGWEVALYSIATDNPLTKTYASPTYTFNSTTLNDQTGIVTASVITPAPANPSYQLRNFIVNVLIQVSYKDAANVNKSEVLRVDIRVHVHDSVTKIWLTPNPLTLWQDTDAAVKFHVYAAFNDMIGDVSCLNQVTWTKTEAKISITAAGVITVNNATLSTGAKTVTATYAGKTANGDVTITSSPTVAANKPKFELIAGGPGLNARTDVANLIILGDGFEPTGSPLASQAAFTTLTDAIVSNTRTMNSVAPWDEIMSKMNVWRYWMPTTAPSTSDSLAGGSIDCELVPLTLSVLGPPIDQYEGAMLTDYVRTIDLYMAKKATNNFLNAATVAKLNLSLPLSAANALTPPAASIATAITAAELNLTKLIAVVGFPTKADIDISLANKITRWNALFNSGTYNLSTAVKPELYTFWRLLAFRFFLNKKDTPLAVTVGFKPHAGQYSDSVQIDIDPYRMTRSYLNKILANATDNKTSPTSIGSLWDKATNGKDANNVVILSRVHISHKGVTHIVGTAGRYFTMSVYEDGSETSPYYISTTTGEYKSLPFGAPVYNVIMHHVFLHELGHLMGGLLDEYGGPVVMSDLNEGIYRILENDAGKIVNTQLRSDLLTAGQIDGNKILWRWPRYETALSLSGIPTTSGTDFVITYWAGTTIFLSNGYKVYLRLRQILPVDVTNQTPPTIYSCPFEIISINATAQTVTIRKVNSGDAFNPALYLRNSLLVKMVTDPFDNTRFAELISTVVRNELTAQHAALNNVSASNTGELQEPDLSYFLPGGSFDTLANMPSDPAKIGGLYYGGFANNDKVLHPFGFCIMRSSSTTNMANTAPFTVNFMCPVCKYILAEKLYPAYHTTADLSYNSIYPTHK